MSIVTQQNDKVSLFEETDVDRRRWILDGNALTLDLVSALSGDRGLTEVERIRLGDLRICRGQKFFSDLLYSITHQHYSPLLAHDLWAEIVLHKSRLTAVLGRNVGIVVAALDYLSNMTSNFDSATLVGEAHIQEIVGLSLRDGLTGLFNHTYFYQQIDFEVRRYIRYGALVSLVLIDIDDFKMVNDTYGHREGDRILARMGGTLIHMARDSDICCRYGGEEFAVILPSTDVHEAGAIASRLKMELAEPLPDGRTVTVSAGVASCGSKTITYQDLVERADAALFHVKRNGKNQVKVVMDEEAGLVDAGSDQSKH